MATLPAFHRRGDERTPQPALKPVPDPFRLRALPLEDVFFHCKRIDNSRLVREADPEARTACWSTIGAAGLLLLLLAGAKAPSVATTLAGYRVEALRVEEKRLLDESKQLELEEARLLSLERLVEVAREKNLEPPKAGQVVHLDGTDSAAVAMAK
jgi:hypothetical protein